MSQMQSIRTRSAPTPIPTAIPIFAPRGSPEALWILVTGKLRANTRSSTTWTNIVGFEGVAVEAIIALRELISAETADGMESVCDKRLKHGVCPRRARSYKLNPLVSD
jgi:hypothetical protein